MKGATRQNISMKAREDENAHGYFIAEFRVTRCLSMMTPPSGMTAMEMQMIVHHLTLS